MQGISKRFILTVFGAFALAALPASAMEVTGAGATFPYPVYAQWGEAYAAETGVTIAYQAVGSGQGIKQIEGRTVVFGASDRPLKPEALASKGLLQFR